MALGVLVPHVISTARLVGVPRARQTVCSTGYEPSIQASPLASIPRSRCIQEAALRRSPWHGRGAGNACMTVCSVPAHICGAQDKVMHCFQSINGLEYF